MLAFACLLALLSAMQDGAQPTTAPLTLGKELRAILPECAGREGPKACARFRVQLDEPAVLYVRVRSRDFQPALFLRELPSRATLAEGHPVVVCDAWLNSERKIKGSCEIEVASSDPLGGEFVLLATREPLELPADILQARQEACTEIARFHETHGAAERAQAFWLQAGEWAFARADLPAMHATLDRFLDPAEPTARTPEGRATRLLFALAEWDGDEPARQAVTLAALAQAIDEDARAAMGGEARLRAVGRAMQLHEQLGELRRLLQGPQSALTDFRRLADLAAEFGQPGPTVTARSKLALVCEEASLADEADRVLAGCESAAASSSERAEARCARARVLALRGESARAQADLHEALRANLKPDLRAEALGTLATTCIDLAQYEEAQLHLDEVAQLVEEHQLAGLGSTLVRLRAVLEFRLGDLAAARRDLEQLLQSAGTGAGAAETAIDLAAVLDLQGRGEEACAQAEIAIQRAREIDSKCLECRAQLGLGRIHERARQAGPALAAYEQGARLAEEIGEESLGALAACGIGCAELLAGKNEAARTHSADAAKRLESLGWTEEALEAHDSLARLALSEHDTRALRDEIAAAARLFERVQRQGLDAWQRAGQRARFAEWGALEQSLVGLELDEARKSGADVAQIALRGWEQASQWKARELLGTLSLGRSARDLGCVLDGSARAAWLPASAALIEYVESREGLHAYVVLRGSVCRVDLGERERMAGMAREFALLSTNRGADPAEIARRAHALWEALLHPVLSGCKESLGTLVIVPAAPLTGVPFEALISDPSRGGEPRCVIDDYLVCYAPASTFLQELRNRLPRSGSGNRFLLVADPLGDDEQTSSGSEVASLRGAGGFGRLKDTRDEACDLAEKLLALHPEEMSEGAPKLLAGKLQRSFRMSSASFDLYLGERSEPGVLRGTLTDYSDLHFAAHALVDEDDPRRSALVLSPGAGTTGRVALEEIWGLKLDANLVVLSACVSAAGRVRAGEGVESLACAFQHAGARAVLASLWPVGDLAAATIQKDSIRRRLVDGLHPARALRAARLAFREGSLRGKNAEKSQPAWAPWYWASWVYIGAPPMD